ncbi:MAG: FIST N-terminal domain-containing protein [Archangium sp.]|nr:FIST N-terminal domain-containing protein [Archangium sp.]MDP3574333.1 FIST N-terminal domain-containing protein [Archangium sp.]
MRIDQSVWSPGVGWSGAQAPSPADLVLVFGARELLESGERLKEVAAAFPQGVVMGCSTSGEIHGRTVLDQTVTTTALTFEADTTVRAARAKLGNGDSYEVGYRVGRELAAPELRHLFVLSDGLNVNGSELVRGLAAAIPVGVEITGGLAGDGASFQRTLVSLGAVAESGVVVAVGLYGAQLRIGCASLGGWDAFGPEREVTRSSGNVLYELDGRSALELYKEYLGEHALGLPASGLLFPLSMRHDETSGVVRTILAVDDAAGSLTFAGDIRQGAFVRLMKANFDRLIDGSHRAALATRVRSPGSPPQLGILISCVGRKLVLRGRVEEEVEAASEALGDLVPLTGFYSYGEISPFTPDARCELHNQTMTITTLSEV